jgi:sugar porter (SP) family MFS transporter
MNVGMNAIEQEGSTAYVYLVAIVAAVSGLLFGFDTAVINGALPFLKVYFELTDIQIEIAASSLLLGCVVGVSGAGPLSDRYGRKRILFGAAGLFLLSAIGAAIPRYLHEFILARFIGGLAIGVASMMAPLYIAEIAPAHIRGRLVSLNQMAIVSGILCSYLFSWLLSGIGVSSWRWMFAIAGLPSFLFMVGIVFMPESPRWLVKQGQVAPARAILSRVSGVRRATIEMEEILEAITREEGSVVQLFQRGLRRPMVIAIVMAVLQQITGINTIIYYSSMILTRPTGNQAASTAGDALRANVIVGITALLSTVIALGIIDKIGRKPLLLTSAGGMGLSMFVLGAAFFQPGAPRTLILVAIFSNVAFFSVGMGPGVWVIMSELFPTRVRGRAMAIATVSLWIACLAVTLTFLSLMNGLTPGGAFWFYGVMCVLTVVFVWKALPETKGKTLEEIEKWWRD